MKTLPIDDHNQGIFSHKLGHFFPIFEKGQGRPPPLPPLVTRLKNISRIYLDSNLKKIYEYRGSARIVIFLCRKKCLINTFVFVIELRFKNGLPQNNN